MATVLTPAERLTVDAAGDGAYIALHRETIDEVLADLRAERAQAVLVSVQEYAARDTPAVSRLVREFPQVPAFALLSESLPVAAPTLAPALLALGQSGVRAVVDVRQPTGWQDLRRHLLSLRRDAIERRAMARIVEALPELTEDGRRFLEACFTAPPSVTTVRKLAYRLAVQSSTLMSRFFRTGLPAPKRYLAFARLVRAAALFENPGLSVAQVAMRLEYSSPQSFGRHVTGLLGCTALSFRRHYDGTRMLTCFTDELLTPYARQWADFHPLLSTPPWLGTPNQRATPKGGPPAPLVRPR